MAAATGPMLVGALEVDEAGVVRLAPSELSDLVGCSVKTIFAPCEWPAWRLADASHAVYMPRLQGVTHVGCRGFRDGGFRLELLGTPAPSGLSSRLATPQTLEAQAAFLVALLDADPHFISVVDAQHRHVFMNRAYAQVMGLSLEAPIRAAEPASESSFDVAVLTRGDSFDIPEVIALSSGERLRVDTAKRRVVGANGASYVLNVAVDMSARQAAERALAETRDRLENAVAAGRLGLWDWDVVHKHMYFSPMWKWQLGFDDDEIENSFEAWQQLLHPDDRARMLDALSEHLGDETQPLYRIEFRLRTKGGDWRWVACSAITTRDSNGRATRLIGCNVDMTETRQYEAKLQATNAHLAHAAKLKDEFLANMSHELRTPLNAVLGQGEAMRAGTFGAVSGEQAEALELIDSSGRHLLCLINDVLDVAKLEAGRLETTFEPVGVEALCRESLAMVAQRAALKGLTVTYTNASGIEAIHGDHRRLKQVLINLLSNAIKFTDRGSIQLEVTLEGRALVLTVRDTGIGMGESELSLLFEPFVQLESGLRRSHEGSGLGLALVKRLVHLHHGSVQVRSTQGQGTVFSVFLPIDDTPLPAPEPTAQRDWGSGKTSLRSALIVDDNDINVLPLRAFLRLSGVDVMVARGAEEAIHLIRDRHPDVTFMDIQMPHIDGFEAMRRLRADRTTADSAIIALTALAMSGDRENCLSAGADAYLSKPVKLREALQLAERVVASKAAASVLRDGR